MRSCTATAFPQTLRAFSSSSSGTPFNSYRWIMNWRRNIGGRRTTSCHEPCSYGAKEWGFQHSDHFPDLILHSEVFHSPRRMWWASHPPRRLRLEEELAPPDSSLWTTRKWTMCYFVYFYRVHARICVHCQGRIRVGAIELTSELSSVFLSSLTSYMSLKPGEITALWCQCDLNLQINF